MDAGQYGTQNIKISGDGASISRISNYIVMSFSILSDKEDVMSPKGLLIKCILYYHPLFIHCFYIDQGQQDRGRVKDSHPECPRGCGISVNACIVYHGFIFTINEVW